MTKTALAEKPASTAASDALKTTPIVGEIKRVPIGTLTASKLNPRKHFEEAALAELADSIIASGVLQPLVVRPKFVEGEIRPSQYEIIIGERRWRACLAAEKAHRLPAEFTVPVIVHPCDDRELVLLAATENLQRKDIHPLDEAVLFKALIDQDITAEQIRAKLGTPVRTIRRRCALLRCAPEIQTAFREGRLTAQQAETFALGAPERQTSYWKDLKRDGGSGWRGDPERIRDDMVQNLLPIAHALFDPHLCKGETVETNGIEYFADSVQTQKLQAKAIDAKIAELKQKWPWVKTVKYAWEFKLNFADAPKDKNAGAVLCIDLPSDDSDRAKLLVRAPVIDTVERQRKAMKTETAHTTAKEKARAAGLSSDHIGDVKAAKTMALRSALIGNRKAALVIAVLGFAGLCDAQGIPMELYDGEDFGGQLTAGDAGKRAKVLAPLAKLLGFKGLPQRHYLSGETAGAALEKLMTWSEAYLANVLGALLAGVVELDDLNLERPGDGPLTLALAAATGAAKRLQEYWKPSKGYIEHLPPARRAMIVDASGRVRNGDVLELFPELEFAPEAMVKKAIETQTKQGEKLIANPSANTTAKLKAKTAPKKKAR